MAGDSSLSIDQAPDRLEQSRAVFDRATRLAHALFGGLAAQVTLFSEGKLWHSREISPPIRGDLPGVRMAIDSGEFLWVEDCTRDPRFAAVPEVAGPPFVRFFAVAPIRIHAAAPGAIWVASCEPRAYDASLARRLEDLAAFVADEWARAESRQAEEAARRESEAANKLVASILDSTAVALVVTDRDMRVLAASPLWLQTRGLEGRDFVGERLEDLIPITPVSHDIWARALAGEVYKTDRAEALRSDGRKVWQQGQVSPWSNAEGEVGGLIITTHEVTDLVLALDEAEAATRAKSAFLATMSHEIRTPLNGVLGMAQAMAMSELGAEQRERLDVIRQSGEGLLAILNDVLDLSKIEAGKLELEHAPFDISELAKGVHSTFAATAQGKGVAFELKVGSAARGVYEGDSVRVRQILCNLVSNALKFTEKGRVSVSVGRRAGVLRLAVKDTGIGISPSQLAGLFQKFEQADASTTRRYGGTGLGLAICRDLVELMGGVIEADSKPGEGTTFTACLPLARLSGGSSAEGPQTLEPNFPTRGAALRVLAAEDNRMNQIVLRTLLGQIGVEPVMVSNGRDAVEAWEREPWDLILMDVQMPEMDGPTAARIIRVKERVQGRPRTPVVALTANAMAHHVAEYREAGMDDFVAKPIEAAKLYIALQNALEMARPVFRRRAS